MNKVNSQSPEYTDLSRDARDLHAQITKYSYDNEYLNQIYKGSIILFSPLINKPVIMFIGINSGAGYFNQCHEKIESFDPLDELEYIEYDYRLAVETKKIFNSEKLMHILKNYSMKSNIFFQATSSEADLKNLKKELHLSYNINLEQISKQWITKLINITQPKIIVCEGYSAFKYLIKFLEIKSNTKRSDNTFESMYGNTTIIGYTRSYSHIKDKDSFRELLKSKLAHL